MDDPTEIIAAGTTEVWEILNLTGDTHPIHFHLVNVQVLSRQPFDDVNYAGGQPTYTGAAYRPGDQRAGLEGDRPDEPGPGHPGAHEVRSAAGAVRRSTNPAPRQQSQPLGGAEYVWHCHILEHEEHDMMRPIIIT